MRVPHNVLGKAWSLTNTALGVACGVVGMAFGGRAPRVDHNALEFLDHPLLRWLPAAALTLGNVVLYAPGYAPDSPRPEGGSGTLADHEHQHTLQGERLGPLYLPSHVLGGITALLWDGAWHGPTNWNERGPLSDPSRPWA